MKNIKNIIVFVFTTVFLLVGCNDNDDKNTDDTNDPGNVGFTIKRELHFTITGPVQNGDYSVLDSADPELTPGIIVLANPYADDTIRLSFKDNNQKLTFACTTPKETGTFQYANETIDDQTITLYFNRETNEETIFISKDLTLNITEFQPLIASINEGASKLSGNFSGTVVRLDENHIPKEEHTIEGHFIFKLI